MPKKMTAQEFKVYYRLLNREDLFIERTFVDASTKCQFIDLEYGVYYAKPRNIKNGCIQGHPARKGERISKTKRSKNGKSSI